MSSTSISSCPPEPEPEHKQFSLLGRVVGFLNVHAGLYSWCMIMGHGAWVTQSYAEENYTTFRCCNIIDGRLVMIVDGRTYTMSGDQWNRKFAEMGKESH